MQSLQAAKGATEYFPGLQARHVDGVLADGVSEKNPGAHQVQLVAPGAEYDPVGHEEQTAAPGADENVPPAQSLQTSGFVPTTLDDFPASHFMHTEDAAKA